MDGALDNNRIDQMGRRTVLGHRAYENARNQNVNATGSEVKVIDTPLAPMSRTQFLSGRPAATQDVLVHGAWRYAHLIEYGPGVEVWYDDISMANSVNIHAYKAMDLIISRPDAFVRRLKAFA